MSTYHCRSAGYRSLAALAAVVLLSSCASMEGTGAPASATSNDCFRARSVRDWRPLDNSNLILFAEGRRPYHVELVRPAMGLSFNDSIGVYDRDGRVCAIGGDAIVVGGAMPERITIRSIRRLTDEELQAVYADFGIETPVIVESEPVDLEPSD